MEESSIKSN